jgi:hypothetical protein
MGEKIIVGPINKGLRTDREPFIIDNDSFPTLINAYQWRGRVKRKRGTSLLTRLQRFFNSLISSYNSGSTTITLSAGAGNLLTGFTTLQTTATIVPGSITINDTTASKTYTDPNSNGILVGSPSGSGTVNYATGAFTISGGATDTVNASFTYYPGLPVLGLESLTLTPMQFPNTIGFDQTYAYNIPTMAPYSSYSVSFYKNPASGTYAGYTQKTSTTPTPTTWNGQSYQQFWTTNYQGSLWTTNGINVPFSTTNIGMQYAPSSSISYTSNTATTLTLVITGSPLVVGDFVFVNEFTGTNAATLNFQTGFVTSVAGTTIIITFPNASLGTGPYTPGIVQYLTNRSSNTIDCLRWYDGDPTNGTGTGFATGFGWVNFAPPLSLASYSIADAPQAQYYLVGARMILPFKDRLLFFGPVIQSSAAGSQIYLQDTIIYSQNGTPYYTASFTGLPNSPTTVFNPILTPTNQSATASAYYEDQTGFGGFVSSGLDQAIITASLKEDAMIVGHNITQTRLIYSGNDILPFNFFIVNSELGSGSTFSVINMDQGVITRGQRGYIITSQVGAQRIDLEIPDQVFEINLTNNGNERFTAQRDFINEWIYLTYPSNQSTNIFPNQSLQYNYRDNSWAIFNEAYTTYGQFYKSSGFTWATISAQYPTWSVWDDPWNSSVITLEQPQIIAGNQQGFVMVRENGTGEGTSLFIQGISGSTITSPNHTLNEGDYIIISGVLGDLGYQVNGLIFSVTTPTANTFALDPIIAGGTYSGGGVITRMYVPQIQTKQFPVAWGMARKTRIGPQQYLLSTTPIGQILLQIFLSQNASFPYNNTTGPANSGLIYTQTLFTCPESTNLGLTAANTNLQMIADPSTGTSPQAQIWHRMNTSLIGDTVQIGFTMSDAQMRSLISTTNTFSITGATQADPCVLTCTSTLSAGQLITISGVVGMTQLNGNTYQVISTTASSVTIGVNSTAFTAYSSGGTVTLLIQPNQFSEIELHALVLDVSPSQVLA